MCFLPFIASVLSSDSCFSVFGKNKASPDTSHWSQKTSYVKSCWISISVKCLQQNSGNEKVRVTSFCLAHTCCLAVADQSEPKLSKMSCKTENIEKTSLHLLHCSVPPLVSMGLHTFTCVQQATNLRRVEVVSLKESR